MLDNRGDGQQCEGAVQGRNQGNAADGLRGGEHGEEDAAECDGRNQIRDEYQLLNNLAVQLAAALRADITDDLAEDGAEYAVDEGELEGVDERVDEVLILEDTRLAFHDVRDRIADPVMQREVGQRVVALTEHEGLEDEQRDRHDDTEDEEHDQDQSDDRLVLAEAKRSGTAALAADGGVGLARTDELLVDKDRNGRDADHDECHCERGLGVLGLAVHVQLAGQGNEVYLGA